MARDKTELVIRINGNIKGYKDALKAASAETEDLQGRFNSIARTGAVAFAGLGASILLAAQQAAKFETIETQFETLLGSVDAAKKAVADLSDFTAKTPFRFEQVTQVAKKLLAFGFQADELKPRLRELGDVAAATGADFGDMGLIFGQVRAAGKLTGERLLQLEERAVPIGPALAKTMGVAETAIRDLVSKGEVDFKTFQKAFKSLSEEGGLAFEGMEKRSRTLEGQLSTLADNFQLLTAEVGKNFLPVLKELAGGMTTFLNFLRENPALADFITRAVVAGTVVGGLAVAIGLAGTVFLKLRASMIAATIATKGLSFAVKGLVGATGLGLIVAFLPEIIQAFQFVFPKAKAIFLGFAAAISSAAKGLLNVIGGIFSLDIDAIKKGLTQLKDAVSAGTEAAAKEFEKIDKAAAKSADETKKAQEDAAKKTKESENKKTDAVIKGVDARTQKLRDENEILKATLAGRTKEEVSALKKRQEIAKKELEAAAIQDKGRRTAALENIKLLNQALDKAEADAAKKREEKEALKTAKAEERAAKEKEKSAERIADLKNENAEISAVLDDREAEEVGFLRRRQEIRDQLRMSEKMAAGEERNLIVENARLKNQLLLEEEEAFRAELATLKAELSEAEAAVEEELATLSTEKRRQLQQAEIDDLIKTFETKEKIRSKAIAEELKRKRKENLMFLEEEEKFGTTFAKLQAFFRSEEIKATQDTARELAALAQSKNATLKQIGKAAALVQIAIDTQRGAIAAYTSLAGIPIVGPALGAAAAAALVAFGIERASRVQALARGGFVGGVDGVDANLAAVTRGEFIVPPQTADEVINAVADQRAARRETEEGAAPEENERFQEVLIGFDGQEAADVLTVRQNEQRFLGVSQAFA